MNPAANTPSFAPGAHPDPVVKAAVLAEALPYMRRYAGHTLVVIGPHRPVAAASF